MKKIEGKSGLAKSASGAVVVTDPKMYHKAKLRKEEKNKMKRLENRVAKLEEMVRSLINGKCQ